MAYIGNTVGERFVASQPASVYSGDGSTTVFTLEHSVASDEDILVSVDGVVQEPSVAYAVSGGTTLTFTSAPSNNTGNNIFVYYLFRTVATVDHPSTSSLLATDGTFSGDLTVDTNTLYVDSANNRVGMGTVSPDSRLQVLDDTSDAKLKITATGTNRAALLDLTGTIAGYNWIQSDTSGTADWRIGGGATNSTLTFATGSSNTERMRIDSSGNLLVGKTASAFGTGGIEIRGSDDASYFTRSGNAPVHINRLSSDGEIIRLNKDSSLVGSIGVNTTRPFIASTSMGVKIAGTEIHPTNSSGTSTDATYNLGSATFRWQDLYLSNQAYIITANNAIGRVVFGDPQDNDIGQVAYSHSDNALFFKTNASEAMRIDSSGNLLVGTTNANPAESNVAGIGLLAGNAISVTDDGGAPIQLNRKTSDGAIAIFRKDGSTVGKITVKTSRMNIGTGDAAIRFDNSSNYIVPWDVDTDSGTDGTLILGAPSARFKDLYLSGGAYIGGTGSANHLDDYEEGTWTPNIGGNSTYNEQTGKYIKVGHKVTLWFTLRINQRNSPAAPYIVAGNPFTNNTSVGGSGVVHYFNSIQNSAVVLTARVDASGGNINLSGATGSATTVVNVNHDWAGNGSAVYGFVTFFSQ